jgi:HCOMODA/2-hydroxy-3-carboxy-muconic semialdehyde decarboxylase
VQVFHLGFRHVSTGIPVATGPVSADIVQAARLLGLLGLSRGYGHVSARLDTDGSFLVTPGKVLTEVTADELEVVDAGGHCLTSNSAAGAPAETPLHTAIYAARPDVGAIVRAQPECVEAFGIAGVEVRPVHDFGATLLGPTAVFANPALIDNFALAQEVAGALGRSSSLMLRGNGCFVVGPDIRTATVCAVWLEESARLQLAALTIARAVTRKTVAYFSEEETGRLGNELRRADRIERKWHALVHDLNEQIGG